MNARWLPRPLHRLALRVAFRIRTGLRLVSKRPLAGVSIVVYNGGTSVLLVRHSYGSRTWALPGGGLHKGEDPAAAAKRELQEELSLEGEWWHHIATFEETLSGSAHTAHLFCTHMRKSPEPDMREVMEARFFEPDLLPPNTSDFTRRRIDIYRQWRIDRRGSLMSGDGGQNSDN